MRVSFAEGNEVRAAGLAQDRVQPLLEPVRFRPAAIRTVKLGVQFGHALRQPDEPVFSVALYSRVRSPCNSNFLLRLARKHYIRNLFCSSCCACMYRSR